MARKISTSLLSLFTLSLVIDQATKLWSETNLLVHADMVDTTIYQGSRIPVLQIGNFDGSWLTFELNYVRNHGAAWGAFANLSNSVRLPLFHLLTISFCAFFLGVALTNKVKLGVLARLGLCLMVSGALGNLVDRVLRGYVIDLFDLRWQVLQWRYALPVFNIADMFVVVGVFILVISAGRR